jgi:TRAP-type C4-dicarboxylate transport system substrate-binding protein
VCPRRRPPDKYGAHYLWYKPFEDNLKRLVGDEIKLEYFPNSQLGKEADVVQQVKAGSVDMMISGPSIWATIVPEIGALDLGFLFDNYAHAFKAIDGGVSTVFDKLLLDRAGVTVLGWGFQVGARSVYTKAPIKSVAELKGVKLRVLPTKAFIDTFTQIGAVPTPIPSTSSTRPRRRALSTDSSTTPVPCSPTSFTKSTSIAS